MIVKIIETKESDGDWLKVYVDSSIKSCLTLNGMKSREEVLKRANEIAQFYWENGADGKVIKEFSNETNDSNIRLKPK